MATSFFVTANETPSRFYDRVNDGDAVTYSFDFRPWQDDNATITGVTWALEAGNAVVGTATTTSGVSTSTVTFSDPGKSLISVTAATASAQKRVYLEVVAKGDGITDDYGLSC